VLRPLAPSRKLCFRLMGATPPEPIEWSPEGPERSGGAVRLDDSVGGGDYARGEQRCSRTFGDWRRYRSAFFEAIGLPAMSEHLPGVTMNGAAGRLALHDASGRALSGHLRAGSRVSSFHQIAGSQSPLCCQATRRYSPPHVNTRLTSKAAPDRYQPQIIFTILRLTAVIAFAPGIFCTPVLWW
jgi:hypothetical protein